MKKNPVVRIEAVVNLPTKLGGFKLVALSNNLDKYEHAVLLHGNVRGKRNVLVRIQSECLTGEVFGSFRCDCGPQLETSLQMILKEKNGILIYMRQEGRGLGFVNKIKSYELMEKGYDTYEAPKKLGLPTDKRDYAVAAAILKKLEVKSIRLITNNPLKIKDLLDHSIVVKKRVPIVIRPNKYDRSYLESKAAWASSVVKKNPNIRKFFQ